MSVNTVSRAARQGNWLTRARDAGSRIMYETFQIPSRMIAQDSAVEIRLLQIPLALTAGAGLLYLHGKQKHRPDGDNMLAPKLLVDASLAYGLLAYTSGLYPLLVGGKAFYDAGKEDTLMAKVKKTISTITIAALGSIGAILGTGYTMHSYKSEAQNIYEWINKLPGKDGKANFFKHLDDLAPNLEISTSRLNPPEPIKEKKLQLTFVEIANDLKNKAKALLAPNSSGNTARNVFDASHLRKLEKHFDFKSELLSEMFESMLPENAFEKALKNESAEVQKNMRALRNSLNTSKQTYVRAARVMNPIFMFLILGVFVGKPLSRWINGRLQTWFPNLKSKSDNQLYEQAKPLFIPDGLVSGSHGGSSEFHIFAKPQSAYYSRKHKGTSYFDPINMRA